jgi:hypothetical protein
MTLDVRDQQRREWAVLYEQIREVLRRFGEEDDHPEQKDYLLVDDNLGLFQHRLETSNLEMVRPVVIKSLQKVLAGYPSWEIFIAVSGPEKDVSRPGMCVVIRDDEIIDGLQREHLPKEFETIAYEGSRPMGSQFGDVIYSGPWRF